MKKTMTILLMSSLISCGAKELPKPEITSIQLLSVESGLCCGWDQAGKCNFFSSPPCPGPTPALTRKGG